MSPIKSHCMLDVRWLFSQGSEDKVQNEGSVTYDIRFEAYVPEENERIKLMSNIESQKDFYPGYPIISRGIYYGARMVSAQNGVEFREPDYGDIKKVYSIWICMGVPKYIGNAISIYEIHKTDIIRKIPVSYPGCKNKKADSSG